MKKLFKRLVDAFSALCLAALVIFVAVISGMIILSALALGVTVLLILWIASLADDDS